MAPPARTTQRWTFGNETIEVALRAANRPEDSGGRFPPSEPGSSVQDGIRVDRDLAVKLRDGVTIYCDVHRPEGATNLPAIIAWSPYGKRAGYAGQNLVQGVPVNVYSAGTKAEGPDPDYWCRLGYAIVNPDARGSGNSEGVIQFWNSTEGKDAADLIEWVATQSWSSGKVGMAGSSWLAISQWLAAAEQPPHLTCIAPWEGMTDLYRHLSARGGIPEIGFMEFLMQNMCGPGWSEDVRAMIDRHPLFDAYWADKAPVLERINVPTYITAGYSHFHLWGSLEAFRRIGTEEKWLRAHRDFEWPDYYQPENVADLRLFFDRYLKGLHNGWEMTPRVRLDVMDYGDRDWATRRAETDFPLPGTIHKPLYLDGATGGLHSSPMPTESKLEYVADSGRAVFDMAFAEGTELTGYFKLRLWVEAQGHDDMDLFVVVQKIDEHKNVIPTLVMGQPHPGSPGMLRVSHRELDEQLSTPSEPRHLHRQRLALKPGEIVPVEIAVWPTSRYWHAGEALRVVVSGHYVRDPGWFEPFAWDIRNKGTHIIHTGGRYDSHLLVPFIPARRPVVPGPLLPPLLLRAE
jgi:predicted acyl esterase